jgi:hypothetical protein
MLSDKHRKMMARSVQNIVFCANLSRKTLRCHLFTAAPALSQRYSNVKLTSLLMLPWKPGIKLSKCQETPTL